jgi:hypothetical protein
LTNLEISKENHWNLPFIDLLKVLSELILTFSYVVGRQAHHGVQLTCHTTNDKHDIAQVLVGFLLTLVKDTQQLLVVLHL